MERTPSRHAPAIPVDAAAPRSDSAAAPCPARPTAPYLPRRPQESPLYRVLADHFDTLERVHEDHFEPTHGPLGLTRLRGHLPRGGYDVQHGQQRWSPRAASVQ